MNKTQATLFFNFNRKSDDHNVDTQRLVKAIQTIGTNNPNIKLAEQPKFTFNKNTVMIQIDVWCRDQAHANQVNNDLKKSFKNAGFTAESFKAGEKKWWQFWKE